MKKDPYKYFRIESRDLLDQLGKGILDLERGAVGPERVSHLLRLAHTLKGAARVVKQLEIADRAHAIEDALAPFRDATDRVPQESVDTVLKLLDAIASRVTALIPAADATATTPGHSETEEPYRTVRADVSEMNMLLNGIVSTHAQLVVLRRRLAALERARYLASLLVEQLEPHRTPDAKAVPKAHSMAEELRGFIGGLEQGLASSAEWIDRELRQLRDATERMRLVPAGVLFTALERVVRDAGRAQDKRVAFEGRGGDVRLDAHVLGAVRGALLQIVRNAVVHGIEPEADRERGDKPPQGRVALTVARRGRRVAFVCMDDGAGVDVAAVRRAAQRKGLVSPELRELGGQDLLHLLLRGGLSTSKAVTEVSGRGIGLDIVRQAAESLGGEVTVSTEAGRGTTLELVVPLSLASLEAMQVEAAGVVASLPLEAVRRALRVAPQDLSWTADGESVVYEEELIPFVPLSRLLHGTSSSRNGQSWSALVVQAGGARAAFGVDRLLGSSTIVLRPLPELIPAMPVVAGASLDAEGKPQLVLDPDGLVLEARRCGAAPAESESQSHPPAVLVIDDSLTTRMLEQSILESAGFEVDAVMSGEEALAKAKCRRYALFLVDIEMPGMDGFTFIERARADPGLRDIPAIVVSSRASSEDRHRGAALGARAYIVKSEFDQAEFLQCIRELAA